MTYGKEDIDYREDGIPSSGYIFNAAESVLFRRVRELMYSDLVDMYKDRETAGAWDHNGLINEFDSWQEEFPEALWILDYKRKYERTYKGTSFDNSIAGAPNTRFLGSMMNGKKKYHRRQFERDQNPYMGTKYVSTSIKTDQIMFRCNTPVDAVVAPNYTLGIVPYSDMYLTVLFGNMDQPKQIRAKAGKTYQIECPLTEMDDTAILIYCASRIQALNDLSTCYIHDNDFSKATKLQKLVLGNVTPGYSNNFLTSLKLGDNKLLEELDIRNCPNLTGSINFSNCSNLKNFFAQGTTITGVVFARNGKIESAYLPESVNSLIMINLMYLDNLNVVYTNLETLTVENSIIDSYGIMNEAADTIKNLRLVGIKWTLENTSLLNQMLKINSSYVSGSVTITGAIRNQEILQYKETWPDLIVSYKPENIVPQFLATYVNADGHNTVLCEIYVDQNTVPPDPYATGVIEKPVLVSDEQYDYSFGIESDGSYVVGSGWDNITNSMFDNRTITAVYTTTIRKYKVSWFKNEGDTVPLSTVDAEYGKMVSYTGVKLNVLQDNHLFKVFTGWDKSTGFIKGNTDVYAVWDSKTIPATGTELKDMSPAEIYAVTQSGRTSDYFEDKDYIDVTLGHDFNFSNVESDIVSEDEYFNGSTARRTEYKLLGNDSSSFTIAIDLRIMAGNDNSTILSCYENNNNNGFRIRLSGNALNIQWGDANVSVSYKNYRDMIVLRHKKGEKQLYVYTSTAYKSDNSTLSTQFNIDSMYNMDKPRRIVLTSSVNILTESPLTLGAVPYNDGTHSFYGTGMIYWCKLWFDDIGNENCEQLAEWHHETIRMEYYGSGKYQLANTGAFCSASFIANNLLEDRGIKMFTTIYPNYVNTFLNERLFPALPISWQSMIKEVTIDVSTYNNGNSSSETIYSNEFIYLPSRSDMNGEISFMESNPKKVKFNEFIIPQSVKYYSSSTDPQTDDGNDMHLGDIWTVSGISYMLIDKDIINKYKLSVKDGTAITNLGGWIASSIYWTRTANVTSNYYTSITQNGDFNDYAYGTSNLKLCPCWSI